jgi:hypothetical protein
MIKIFGLDLSLNSTGICSSVLVDEKCTNIRFDRFIFLDNISKNIKQQLGVVQHQYVMPTNMPLDDLLIIDDVINREQIESSIKTIMCARQIQNFITSSVTDEVKTAIFCIENYIMPSYSGKNQLKTVGSLINLQGYIRETIIRLNLTNGDKSDSLKIKLIVPSPSSVKKFFSGNGNANKIQMIESFFNDWSGRNFIENKGKIDDLVDAFALMQYACGKILHEGRRTCDIIEL